MDRWYSKNSTGSSFGRDLIIASILIGSIIYAYGWKLLAYDQLDVPLVGYELRIEPGTSLRQFANQLYTSGLLASPTIFRWYVTLTGNANNIKAGEYKIDPGTTPQELLEKVLYGAVAQYSFTIIEGWQSSQLLQELWRHPKIKATFKEMSNDEILAALQLPEHSMEGIFLPDTYFFEADTSDADFLKRAYTAMQQTLQVAWEERDPKIMVTSPYQALVLASIIEKESAIKEEYAEISGVYNRRLQRHMKLQADPTVIYAIQHELNGPLLRKHLKVDSPYNTYKYSGLPPTPIALPSAAAINAALHPAAGDTLYFVASGDGGHVFSKDLVEHNKAVRDSRR